MSRAWFKFYGRDYRDGVRELPFDVVGIYSVLLTLLYEEPGARIKDHDQRLSRLVGCDIRMWRRARSALMAAGKLRLTDDGFLINDRAEIEAKSAELLSEVRAISGRSSRQLTDSNKPKLRKTKEPPEAIASSLPLYARALPESESERTPSLRSGVTRKLKTRISVDDPLTEDRRRIASEFNVLNGSAEAIWAHFRDHHYANDHRFIDWDAAWRNWLRRQPSFQARAPQARPSMSDAIDRAAAKAGIK